MAESKYSLRLAAVDAYSSTFGDFKRKTGALEESIKQQSAELQKLNSTARSLDGYARLSEKLKGTQTELAAARVEQARLGREHKAADQNVEQLTAAHGKAAAAHRELASSVGATAGQVRTARAEEARLARELKSAEGNLAKLNATQDKATASVRTLDAARRTQSNGLKQLQGSLTAAGVDTGKLASEQKRLEAATESANSALSAQRGKLEAVRNAQGRVEENRNKRSELRGQMVETAALAYLASRPINEAMELETAMADVGKVINFEDGGRERMAGANLKMASDRLIASSGMTAVDLAKIEYAAGQSGIGNDQKDKDGKVDPAAKERAIMDFTRDAAIMGSAFDIDAQTAGETMAGWRASMGLDRTQTLDLADSTNYLGNNFNATAADIASVVKRYGAVGKASGLTPEQSAALSAAFLNPGTEKEIAGTGFKNFTAALTKGEAATKGQKEVWEKLGFTPEDLAKDMQGNAPETIMKVLEAIRAEPVEEQAAVATQLFGSESIGAIQPLLQNLGEVQRAFDMVKDKSKYATSAIGEQGSMMQEAAGVANTSRTGWNSFTAKLTRLSTLVGNAMLPALNAVLTPLGAMVDALSWAAETFPGVAGGLAVAAAGLVALKVGALGLKYVGLLFGQGGNRLGQARAGLNARTEQTAKSASQAVARLNGAIGRLGRQGGSRGLPPDRASRRRRGNRVRRRNGGGGPPDPDRRNRRNGGGGPPDPDRRNGRRGTPPAPPGPPPPPGPPMSRRQRLMAKAMELGSSLLGGDGDSLSLSGGSAGGGDGSDAPRSRFSALKEAAADKVRDVVKDKAQEALDDAVSEIKFPWSKDAEAEGDGVAADGSAPPPASELQAVAVESPADGVGAAAAAAEVSSFTAPVAEAAGYASDLLGGRAGALGAAGSVAAKVATPLKVLSAGADIYQGIQDGSAEGIGGGLGRAGGGLAGATAGASVGAAVGSVVPVIGTAIGAVIGGLVGGFAGSEVLGTVGESLGRVVDKLRSPEETAASVVASSSEEKKEVNFAPVITMQASGDPAYDQRQADNILARLKTEVLAMFSGAGDLAVRRSSSLTDGSD